MISQNSATSLCQEIIMLKKKMKSPFQAQYNCDWIKVFCYRTDKGFRIIGDVNIWRVKNEIIFKKNTLFKALLHFRTPFFTLIVLVNNFMLITLIFLKQLGSGLTPQNCLYFQGFRGSKFVNDSLLVWPSNLCLLSC